MNLAVQMSSRATFPPLRITRYAVRVALASIALVVLTLAAVVFAPRVDYVSVIGQTPERDQVPLDSIISVTFSRPVDQRSAERSMVIYPLVKGRLSWRDDQTVVFTPSEPLRPKTIYHITIRPGLRDARGRINRAETLLSFRTR
jgi:Bacterial Ig-like domain